MSLLALEKLVFQLFVWKRNLTFIVSHYNFDILWIKLETNIFRLNDEGGDNQNHSLKWIYN